MERVLNLVLSRRAYEVTGTPEKMFELRKYSKWIESRLYKNGEKREYDFVEICDGYKKGRETKKFRFAGCGQAGECNWEFANGLEFTTVAGDYIIHLMPLL